MHTYDIFVTCTLYKVAESFWRRYESIEVNLEKSSIWLLSNDIRKRIAEKYCAVSP